jgi:hypothetical protein
VFSITVGVVIIGGQAAGAESFWGADVKNRDVSRREMDG